MAKTSTERQQAFRANKTDEELKAIKKYNADKQKEYRLKAKLEKEQKEQTNNKIDDLKVKQKELEKQKSINTLTNAIKNKKAKDELKALKIQRDIFRKKEQLYNPTLNKCDNCDNVKQCINNCFKVKTEKQPTTPKTPKIKTDKPPKTEKPKTENKTYYCDVCKTNVSLTNKARHLKGKIHLEALKKQ